MKYLRYMKKSPLCENQALNIRMTRLPGPLPYSARATTLPITCGRYLKRGTVLQDPTRALLRTRKQLSLPPPIPPVRLPDDAHVLPVRNPCLRYFLSCVVLSQRDGYGLPGAPLDASSVPPPPPPFARSVQSCRYRPSPCYLYNSRSYHLTRLCACLLAFYSPVLPPLRPYANVHLETEKRNACTSRMESDGANTSRVSLKPTTHTANLLLPSNETTAPLLPSLSCPGLNG